MGKRAVMLSIATATPAIMPRLISATVATIGVAPQDEMDRGKTCFIGRRLDCGRQLFNFSLSAVGRRLAAFRKGRARCGGWDFATTKKSICLPVCGRLP